MYKTYRERRGVGFEIRSERGWGRVCLKIEKYDYEKRIEKVKELTKEFREIIKVKFPEMTEIDVDLITDTLGIELKHIFRKF